MAGIVIRGNTAQVALTATTAKTVMQIVAASNHRVLIDRIIVSMEGATSTDAPTQVRVLLQTTAGTMSALTLAKDNALDTETMQTTAQHTATVEPTASTVLETTFCPTYNGRVVMGPFVIPGGVRLGVELTSPASLDCIVSFRGTE